MRQDSALPAFSGTTLFAAAGALLLLAWLALRPASAPVPDGPPASGFSASRALAHVKRWRRRRVPPAASPTGGRAITWSRASAPSAWSRKSRSPPCRRPAST
jgi:hypothetical protein